MTYDVVNLFAGAGGLSLGFKQTGKVNIVAVAENNPNANRQKSSIISMNNRLVKEYVRAICALNPRAFVNEGLVLQAADGNDVDAVGSAIGIIHDTG